MKIAPKLFCFGILFLYIYSINFSFLPISLGSRVYLSMAGFGIMAARLCVGARLQFLTGKFGNMMAALVAITLLSIMSILVNQTTDLEFVKYFVSMMLIVAASYFVSFAFSRTYRQDTARYLMFTMIACVSLQCMLAIVLFVSEPIKELLMSLINASEVEADLISSTGEFRLVGFGSTFFGAGITNGITLLLIAFCVRYHVKTRAGASVLGVAFLFIGIVGLLMSRTTAVGLLLALLYILLSMLSGRRSGPAWHGGRFLASLGVAILVGLAAAFTVIDFSVIEPMLNWAFEPVINYFTGDGLTSESTDQLLDMYGGINFGALPWAIGDAMFYDPYEAGTYYMHVDVGYLRLIFYFGLPGLLLYFFFQLRAITATLPFFKFDKFFVWFVVLDLILLNFKGFADFFVFSILFFMCHFLSVPAKGTPRPSTNFSPYAPAGAPAV